MALNDIVSTEAKPRMTIAERDSIVVDNKTCALLNITVENDDLGPRRIVISSDGLTKAYQELQEAREVIRFYAKIESWEDEYAQGLEETHRGCPEVARSDIEDIKNQQGEEFSVGGKRAREHQKKWGQE